METFEQRIADAVNKKMNDGTVEKLVEQYIEKGVSDVLSDTFMGEITKSQALEAYNTLIGYCSMQGSCENCLLSIGEESDCGECVMEIQDFPRGWQPLDLD